MNILILQGPNLNLLGLKSAQIKERLTLDKLNKKIIVFIAFVISVFTEVFVGFSAFIAAIPIIGPMIIKIVTIPVFWVFNAMGTLVSGLAIKKGYATELAKGRILTLALLIGMIIGYILGNLIPLQ